MNALSSFLSPSPTQDALQGIGVLGAGIGLQQARDLQRGLGQRAQLFLLDPHDPADAKADPDHDGFPNLVEYWLSTSPRDPASRGTLADNNEQIIACWPLRTDAADALGSGLDGTLMHGASCDGSAVSLDGRNDYVDFSADPELSVTGSISYCVWLMPEDDSRTMRVVGKS